MSPPICHPSGSKEYAICQLLNPPRSALSLFRVEDFSAGQNGLFVKNKHVQTAITCFLVVGDEDSKENLRKILQKKTWIHVKG